MITKVIKLINNERINAKVHSAKGCISGANDVCTTTNYDNAYCMTYAVDHCGKDYTACREGAHDICTYIDEDRPCSGAGTFDECSVDYIYNEKV